MNAETSYQLSFSRLIFLLVLFLGMIVSCSDQTPSPSPLIDTTTPSHPPGSASAPTAWTQEPPIPTTTGSEQTSIPAPEPPTPKNQHYILTAELDYAGHLLEVVEEISYTNNSPDSLDELVLMVEPNRYPGVFNLISIEWGGGISIEGLLWEHNNLLRLPLPQALDPGESVDLDIEYQLHLPSPAPSPDIRPIPFGYTERQTNLVDWYPYIPPYDQDQGWLAHEAGFFGEHQVYELSDFEVSIRLLDQRDDLVIAASSPGSADGAWQRYSHLNARNFVWSVSHQYQVMTGQVGEVTVMGYSFLFDTVAGETVLQTTLEAMELYQGLFGPYPREILSVVEADFLDGMEFDGLYFLSNGFYNIYQGTKSEFLVAIAAHETAHQWWYAQVGSDQALEPWLDEALCTYSERLFYENVFPDALDWWWQFRIDYYEPQGYIDRTIYEPGGYRAYRDAVYLNGALFLEELRQLVGERAFFDFLLDYSTVQAGKLATTADFFTLLRAHTDKDISSLMDRYFQNR